MFLLSQMYMIIPRKNTQTTELLAHAASVVDHGVKVKHNAWRFKAAPWDEINFGFTSALK